MTETQIQQLHDEAFATMGKEPLEAYEPSDPSRQPMTTQHGGPRPAKRPDDKRRSNPGGARQGAGPKPKPKVLILNGIEQPGHWRLVSSAGGALVLETVTTE